MVKTNYTTNELYIQAMEITELPDDIVKYTKLIKLDCIYPFTDHTKNSQVRF